MQPYLPQPLILNSIQAMSAALLNPTPENLYSVITTTADQMDFPTLDEIINEGSAADVQVYNAWESLRSVMYAGGTPTSFKYKGEQYNLLNAINPTPLETPIS